VRVGTTGLPSVVPVRRAGVGVEGELETGVVEQTSS